MGEKLRNIVDCKNLVQISSDIEKRIRGFFKDYFAENETVSRSASLDYIGRQVDQSVTQIKISEIEHI